MCFVDKFIVNKSLIDKRRNLTTAGLMVFLPLNFPCLFNLDIPCSPYLIYLDIPRSPMHPKRYLGRLGLRPRRADPPGPAGPTADSTADPEVTRRRTSRAGGRFVLLSNLKPEHKGHSVGARPGHSGPHPRGSARVPLLPRRATRGRRRWWRRGLRQRGGAGRGLH